MKSRMMSLMSAAVGVMMAVSVTGCTSVQSVTEDKGQYSANGATYRHLTTTITIERDPLCVASCAERP